MPARLAHLLDDLLALAREDAAGPGPTDAVRLDRLALELASPRVAVDAPAPVTVRGDAHALARAIANLIENALVHGPAGEPVDDPGARGSAAAHESRSPTADLA